MWNNCKKGTQNAAVKIIRHITKHELERITIEEGYRIYAENNTTQADLSQEYCKQVVSKVKKFSDWRNSRNLHYMDEVDNSVARQYSIFLWEKNIAPSVHDAHIKTLSKFFQDIDSLKTLPNRNPFNVANVKRKKHGYRTEASHKAFSPFMIAQVLKSAANAGQDWLDLFILGLNTGMRLKDAALFEWQQIDGKFVEYYPYKTKRFQNRARVGISPALQEMLERRVKSADMNSPYLFPEIAQYYFSKSIKDYLTEIFENALGKNIVRCKAGNHRIKNSSIYGFHSFRATFTTALARQQVHHRDAMRMLGWSSMEMVRNYEREMEELKAESDMRSINAVCNMPELKFSAAEISSTPQEKFQPTKDILEQLIARYSNLTIGKIYKISNVAVKHWLDKFGLKREKRIESADISDEEIQRIRISLQKAA